MTANVIIKCTDGRFAAVRCQFDNLAKLLRTRYSDQKHANRLARYPMAIAASLSGAWLSQGDTVYVWNGNKWMVGTSPDSLSEMT